MCMHECMCVHACTSVCVCASVRVCVCVCVIMCASLKSFVDVHDLDLNTKHLVITENDFLGNQ